MHLMHFPQCSIWQRYKGLFCLWSELLGVKMWKAVWSWQPLAFLRTGGAYRGRQNLDLQCTRMGGCSSTWGGHTSATVCPCGDVLFAQRRWIWSIVFHSPIRAGGGPAGCIQAVQAWGRSPFRGGPGERDQRPAGMLWCVCRLDPWTCYRWAEAPENHLGLYNGAKFKAPYCGHWKHNREYRKRPNVDSFVWSTCLQVFMGLVWVLATITKVAPTMLPIMKSVCITVDLRMILLNKIKLWPQKVSVCRSNTFSYIETSQLTDGFQWYFVQTFMSPRRWILQTLVMF